MIKSKKIYFQNTKSDKTYNSSRPNLSIGKSLINISSLPYITPIVNATSVSVSYPGEKLTVLRSDDNSDILRPEFFVPLVLRDRHEISGTLFEDFISFFLVTPLEKYVYTSMNTKNK